ncbi:STAS-like domain-containing protein [Aliidiomarina haloalkalitolerans]|uniref:DUF4325 domain-containing protein n=1 Tax=Aliidiomarina haloalkalitolerans TaxID=859059 RepID=A0A432VRI4_9GAMM|nr:STAS-like domain-containing protein [Aliidiomarina haloalkalitolerans]RUO18914.1 DUF4325 domain-containing protein [Aliidiomarina haloalkalitolerans]
MKINIGAEFSVDPAGRYYSDGDASGEAFREEYLLPALRKLEKGEKLTIILDDGIESYGSSFLSEAFGGIVKHGYFDSKTLLNLIEIKFSNEEFAFFKDRIITYVNESKFNSEKYTRSSQ